MEMSEILPGIYAIGTALWISEKKILVLGDVHLGYEKTLSERGYLIPQAQFRESVEVLNKLFGMVRPKMIVINGDLKHEFGHISDQEWMDTSKFIDILSEHCEKIILVKGNHDTVLGPIARKKNLELVGLYEVRLEGLGSEAGENKVIGRGNSDKNLIQKIVNAFTPSRKIKSICILHGDKIVGDKVALEADLLIIGHDHPAAVLHDGPKNERYKVFLLGKWGKQKLIVMPSFIPTIEGTDVKREGLLSPYLNQDIDDFEVFIVGDRVYKFGKLKSI